MAKKYGKKAATTATSDKTSQDKEREEIAEIRKLFEHGEEQWSENRKRWLEDSRFYWLLEHWPAEAKDKRDEEGRITVVVDKLQQHGRQVVNDSRQNRPGVLVIPAGGQADKKTADKISGLFRAIAQSGSADAAYDTGIEHAIVGGFGYLRVHHDYAGENSFNQELKILRVPNPLAVLTSQHNEADGSDIKWAFYVDTMTQDDFKAQYPDAEEIDWTTDVADAKDWFGEKEVRVAEYWWVKEEEQTLHLLDDGNCATDEELGKLVEQGGLVPQIVDSRKVPMRKCWYCKLNGKQYLEKPREWPSRYVPIIPVYGNEANIEGDTIRYGMFHAAKDAQLLYDYAASAFAERAALAPDAPMVAAVGQIQGVEEDWDGSTRVAVKRYNPVEINGTALPPPQREQPPDVPLAFAQLLQHCEHDIEAAVGRYAASIGKRGNATSGKQEMLQQREGDVGSFHYHDNLARAMRHAWRVVLDMAPHIYDTRQLHRILGEDGSEEMVTFDPNLQVPAKQRQDGTWLYSLGVGKYDVAISVGPSYTTRRQEAAQGMIAMAQANPASWQTHGDLIAKAQDWPMSEEFAKRSELLLPSEIRQAKEEEQSGQIPPEAQTIVQQAKMALQERDQVIAELQQALQQLQQQAAQLENDKTIDAKLKERELDIKAYEAETKRMAEVAKMKQTEGEIKEVASHLDQLTETVARLVGVTPAEDE